MLRYVLIVVGVLVAVVARVVNVASTVPIRHAVS